MCMYLPDDLMSGYFLGTNGVCSAITGGSILVNCNGAAALVPQLTVLLFSVVFAISMV
jgi:hypothetical protein